MTLVELLVVLALMLLIASILVAIMVSAQKSENKVRGQADVTETIRTALEQFSRDARQGGAVTAASCTQLSFVSYFKSSTPRSVTYDFSSGTLSRRIGSGAATPVATGLVSGRFASPGRIEPTQTPILHLPLPTATPAPTDTCFPAGSAKSVRLELAGLPKGATQPITLGITVAMRNSQ